MKHVLTFLLGAAVGAGGTYYILTKNTQKR